MEAYTELDQRVIRRTAALERASAALRERNALLNAITTSTPDLIFAKDRQGRTLMANPAWFKAMGKAEHDVVVACVERAVEAVAQTPRAGGRAALRRRSARGSARGN